MSEINDELLEPLNLGQVGELVPGGETQGFNHGLDDLPPFGHCLPPYYLHNISAEFPNRFLYQLGSYCKGEEDGKVKVEATKFTEVGYVGRDVESIIRDLADVAVKMVREAEMEKVQSRAEELAEDRVLDILLPQTNDVLCSMFYDIDGYDKSQHKEGSSSEEN